MAQYRIIESRPATYYWEYIVEAKDETEALNKVLNDEIEADEAWCEENDNDDSEFEVYPADDDNDDE